MVSSSPPYRECKLGLSRPDLHKRIHLALANVQVDLGNTLSSFRGKPNCGRVRLKPFANLLNELARYQNQAKRHLDLVIFPEVSIPYVWESMIVAWARKHHIGVVCGLEHRTTPGGVVLNEVLAALPYRNHEGYWACVPVRRLKREYSPEEKELLQGYRLKVPAVKNPYDLFRWRGASFAVYNCYELADIVDRGLFKAKVDFLVATEFNRDVHYFSNIVEAAARDLHSYVIQVNTAQFGDSRVIRPSNRDLMNPVQIKGGENLTFLAYELDLDALRQHQLKEYVLQKKDNQFKPTPPSFEIAEVQKRIDFGD